MMESAEQRPRFTQTGGYRIVSFCAASSMSFTYRAIIVGDPRCIPYFPCCIRTPSQLSSVYGGTMD